MYGLYEIGLGFMKMDGRYGQYIYKGELKF